MPDFIRKIMDLVAALSILLGSLGVVRYRAKTDQPVYTIKTN